MKKKFRKLNLSTETVRHLTEPNLKEVVGEAPTTDDTRPCSFCTVICSICCP